MSTKSKIALAVLPLLVAGWALFRPELLFLENRVDEPLDITRVLKQGSFVSYAHETTGEAKIVEAGGKPVLRLEGFSTSNGPEVRVYLVRGSDSSSAGLEKGFLDLGILKGNIGSQNYPLPEATDLSAYNAVAIWCKRFSVGFGGATLK